ELLQEAEYFYRESIKYPLSPAAEPLIYGSLLRVLWKGQRFEDIVQTCRAALKQTQSSNRVLLRADLARALGYLQRWDDALAEIDQAGPDAKGTEEFTVRHLRVRLLTQAGRFDQAEAECRALLKDHALPGEVLEVRYLLSHVYSVSNRMPEAEAELAECLKIDPTNPSAGNDLAYLWAEQNKNLAE